MPTDNALLDAEVGTYSSSSSLGSPAAHPAYPAVAPLCRQYPTQASAVFQAYLDLKNGAAAWDVVEPLALSSTPSSDSVQVSTRDLSNLTETEADKLIQERLKALRTGTAKVELVNGNTGEDEDEQPELIQAGLAAIKGRRKDAKSYEVVIPLSITHHLRPSQLKAIFTLIEAHAETCPAGQEVDTSHVLLAIIAPDSTLVYYIVSQGMVKPIN